MPAFRQNLPNCINRDPDSQRAGSHLQSYPVYAPSRRPENLGASPRWTPFGNQQPGYDDSGPPGGRALMAARWDGLGGRLMDVPQADTYNAVNPWPANSVWDEPGAQIGSMGILRLQPTTSAHPGQSSPSGEFGPTMLFHAPPVFSMQTRPVLALGL